MGKRTRVYNPVTGTYEYSPPGAEPTYNEVAGGFRMRETNKRAGYNPVTNEWEAGAEDYGPCYDPLRTIGNRNRSPCPVVRKNRGVGPSRSPAVFRQ